MTLSEYWRIVRDRWRIIAATMLVGALLSIVATLLTPTEYQASAQVYVNANVGTDPLAQYQAAYLAQQEVATFAKLIHAPGVLAGVRRDLNLNLSDQALSSKISAETSPSTSLIYVTATDSKASQAADIANSAARSFASVIEGYAASASKRATVRLIVSGPASQPSSPVQPRPVVNLAFGLLLGLFLGTSMAFIAELLDRHIKSTEDLVKASRAPSMGVIVEDQKTKRHPLASRAGAQSIRAENFRQLRANLQFANVDQHPRVIAVTSAIPGEGKTTVAINLASSLAEAGFTVCLVDADLRRPTIATTLGMAGAVGLTSVLIHQIDVNDALQNAGSNLYVLSSGPLPPNPSEVLASSFVRTVIRQLLDNVDYVILDTAPVLPVSDGSEVCALADGALLVARYGKATDAQIKRAVQTLRRVDANLVGVVLNRVPVRRSMSDYGYGYYAAAASTTPAPDARRPRPTR